MIWRLISEALPSPGQIVLAWVYIPDPDPDMSIAFPVVARWDTRRGFVETVSFDDVPGVIAWCEIVRPG